MNNLERRVAELERIFSTMIRRVSVHKTESGQATIRVKDDSGFESGSVEYFQGRQGQTASWSPVDDGEQGLLFCPDGNPENGVFLGGLPSKNSPAISDNQDELRNNLGDGGFISYNRSTGEMNIQLMTKASIKIGGVTFDVEDGQVTMKGANLVLPDDDVIARQHSLDNHKHPGILPGGSTTGAAIP